MGVSLRAHTLSILTLFLSVSFGAPLVQSSDSPKSSVLVLDDANFSDAIASHEHLVVVFHTRWCQHCRRLMPKVR